MTVFKSELFATTTDVGGNTSLAKHRVGDRKVANPWSIPKLAMCRVLGKDTSRVFPIGVDRPSCLPVVVAQLTKYLQTAEVESRTQGSRPRPRTQKKSEAKAKDSLSEDRHSRGQGQECSRPRPRTQSASALQKKKKKKVFTKIFQAISTKKRFPKNFSSAPQNFNIPKNSAVLEPRTGQFSRT